MSKVNNLVIVTVARDSNTGKIKEYKNKDAIKKVIEYVMREKNTKYISGYGVSSYRGAKSVIDDFKILKKMAKKTKGRQLYHIIISFRYLADADTVFQIVKKVCRELLQDMQYVFAVHTNTEHLHAHIVINSVTLEKNYRKIHFSIKEGAIFLQQMCDVCVDYLNPLERYTSLK